MCSGVTKEVFIKSINDYRNANCYEHSRENSWRYCYDRFNRAREERINDAVLDELCLNLAFYLASWGMYRGSAFLYKFDYKVHKPVVEEIMKEKYIPLMGVDPSKTSIDYELLFHLKEQIQKIYQKLTKSGGKTINVTDTLVTKIMLGTLCCAPAYDSCFVATLKHIGLPTTFDIDPYKQLIQYCTDNKFFEDVDNNLPLMKSMDMAFWQIGYGLIDKRRQR